MRLFLSRLASGSVISTVALILAIGIATAPAEAQVLYGSIIGNVTDQNGAVVPGATVTITNKGTGQVRETVTDSEGVYSIVNILPGIYDLKIGKQGFTTFTKLDLTITANNITRTNVEMKIGNVADIVQVAADATVLQTESATVKSEISGKEIQSMPLSNYRNYQSLINLVPGSTPAAFQNASTDTPERALTTNINGTARNNNNTRLDGAQSVNIWLPHHSAYVPPSESVQEVNVSTNNFDAEQGLAGGAAIQVITKAGTNEFHGSAFAYHDNHFFRAKNAFYPTTVAGAPNPNKPKNLRTIPGATLGGPIIRDKVFFFGSWEGMYERTIGDGFFTVPTPELRAGDFSATNTTIFDPLTGNLDGTARTAFAGNTIPTNRIHPAAARMLALVPLPNLRDANGNFLAVANLYASQPGTFDRNNYDIKVNFNRNENHQLWTKFSHMNASVVGNFALGAAGGGTLGAGGSGTGTTKSYVGTIGHTWTLGSGFIVDGNFSVTHRNHNTIPPDYGQNVGLDVLGIPGTNGPDIRQSGTPQFFFTTYSGLGNQNGWSPVFRDERSYTFTQNATRIVGNHDVRFGVDIVKHLLDHWQPEIGVGPRGGFNFSGNATTLNGGTGANQFNSFASFLLGMPNQVQKSLQYEKMTTREWQMGFYVRDRWQASRNLTLTLGLRYELFPMMTRADRGIERLDLNSPVVLNTAGNPNGVMNVLIGGRGGNPDDLGVGSSKKLFAPRLGFAYRIGDDTVIRGGYGITYDPMPFGRPLRGFYPLTIAQSFVATALDSAANEVFTPWGFTSAVRTPGLTVGIPDFTGPDLSTGVVELPGTVQMRSPYEGTLNRGYIQSWNLMVERKLISDIKIEVGYVGTGTRNQFGDIDINVAQTPNSTRILQQKYGRTASTLMWDGFASTAYHALQVAVNRRYSSGLFIKGAYTWSKAINYFDDSGWAGLPLFRAGSDIGRNRGLAGYDIPHNVQVGAAYELPFGDGKTWMTDGVASAIFGGWTLSGIGNITSGRPLNVTAAGGSLNSPGNTQTPDLIGEISYPKNTGPNALWFDPNAFRPVEFSPEWLASVAGGTPRPFRYGTAGRSVLRGPGFANLDLSLVRTFRITERVTTDFRVDAFNFTNTPWFANPGTNASAPTRDAQGNILRDANGNLRTNGFGEVRGANQTQRQFRFGIRIGF
ncbi:MAG: TonB-dependent receptor [Acidobacteriota bacterium]|nr:MAG: TonB-dependent receptor [Acidobacteriota bacterium]